MMWGSLHTGPTFFSLLEMGQDGDFRLLEFGVSKCILCDYCSLGLVSTLTKWIIIFFKKLFHLKIWNLKFPLSIVTCVMKLFRVQPMIIMMIFKIPSSYFTKILSLLWRLFNDKTDLSVRYLLCSQFVPQLPNSSTLYRICFAQSPPLFNYIDSSKEKITLGVLWECGKI
jgi:hypothetical protein